MDMKISGSGKISAGEYDNIRISGSGRLEGLVRCASFHVSGSSRGDTIECRETLKISGSTSFDRNVKAGSIGVSGSFSCGGDLCADEKVSVSGSTKCGGSLKCTTLSVAGSMRVGGDAEAETVNVDGILNCAGLLNAEQISIRFERGMDIGSIGGSKIVIYPRHKNEGKRRLALLASLINRAGKGSVEVKGDIEGDEIALEGVVAKRVSGRTVAIGEGCEIELVQYSETVEISPDAKVGRTEQI